MNILVVAEHRNGQFKRSTFEAVTAAAALGKELSANVAVLVIGKAPGGSGADLGAYGAARVIIVDEPRLQHYSTTAYAKIAGEIAAAEKAEVILFAATAQGKDCAPRVAARLDAGLASDCTALRVQGGSIVATRPVYAGKALLEVAVRSNVKIFSLRPNVFTPGTRAQSSAVEEARSVSLTDDDFSSVVREVKASGGRKDVAEADIIVSGGRGLRAPENFRIVEELAAVLGGAVGASRAVVDAGWRPHDEQVGQTGKTVSPTVYFAVGISGAVQHLAGMSSSKCIVAINKDKDAPIFSIADYGIVGDALEVVPALTAELRKAPGK